jgi:ankyrin repeat protein
MNYIKQTWNNIKSSNLEASAVNFIQKKKYEKFIALIPKWEDYEQLKIDEHPALIHFLLMEQSEKEIKETLLSKFSDLKYKAKAVNCDKNQFLVSPYHLAILNNELDTAEKFNEWGGNIT